MMTERSLQPPSFEGGMIPDPRETAAATESLIVSLVGPTGVGKSSLATAVSGALADRGISSVIIKKDTAIRALSQERFGNEWRGYTALRGIGPHRFTEQDLNHRINEEIQHYLGKTQVIFLEGGTRTRKAMQATLRDVDTDYIIVKMAIPPYELIKRLRERRKTDVRNDDRLALMMGKLVGQFVSPKLTASPKEGDPDVVQMNASKPLDELAEETLQMILAKLHPESQPANSLPTF